MNGIPVLSVSGKGIAESWERSLIALHENGLPIRTMYDKPGDPPSKDATMMVIVEDPLAEPMIHKDFPGGPEDLQEYVMEVVDGIKDHWVRKSEDPRDTRWGYSYHNRLFSYEVTDPEGVDQKQIWNQIEVMCRNLAETPHTRRAQAVTWKVWEDNGCYDPPCLQSIWGRITEDQNRFYLSLNVRFRSNDAYKAAFMNMFALVQLQRKMAGRIAELMQRPVLLGRYVHMADSYHLYGAYFKEFDERFLSNLTRRSFAERTLNYSDVIDIMEEAKPRILEKAKNY